MCAATVNSERTLLAFTVKEEVDGETTYDTFVAEIAPEGRVFTLNLKGREFRKIQFIQLETSASKGRAGKSQVLSRLLIVVPTVFFAVYTFRLQAITAGYTLMSQPEQEILSENFSWYQWDPAMQWLYYAQFESSASAVQTSFSGRNSLVLNCTSLARLKPELLLTIALPLPYNEGYYVGEETYFHSPLALSLPVREMNLQVLYQREGFWCVCLQHTRGTSFEEADPPEQGKLDYTVYIIHNGHMLYMQVPLPIPIAEPLHIHFMLLGCFVVAYIPHFMLHLLNVGPKTDPCHHLAFGPSETLGFPIAEGLEDMVSSEGPILSSGITASPPGQYTTPIMECATSVTYEVSINASAFLELFKTTANVEMMEDLLHLTIVGLRHHGMALVMMEHLCQSPMRLGDHRIFAEFLVSFAYANTTIECRHYIAKQLPLTMTPTYCGRLFKNPEGMKFAMLQLNPMRNFINQLLVQSDQRLVKAKAEELLNYEVGDQPFEMLCFIAVTSQPSLPRVNIAHEMESVDQHHKMANRPLPLLPSTKKKSGKAQRSQAAHDTAHHPSNFLNRISTSFARTSRTTNTVAPTAPATALTFLEPDIDQEEELEKASSAVHSCIKNVVGRELTSRSKNTVSTAISTYCSELERHSSSLLHLIWDSLGFSPDTNPLNKSLYRLPTSKEEILFELLEAYYLAHLEIGLPTPSGFQTLFVSLGFVCLSDFLFLQYLRSGVFVPTKRFISLLLQDVKKEKEHMVYEILCHLEQDLADWAFKQWNNPTIEALRAAI